jgi:hypothetical protein
LLAWLAVLGAGAWLRLWQIGIQIPVDDEWHALHRLMQAGYAEIFLSFGHADYSIPLTLLFRALADTVGLVDWQMRLLPMAFGLAALVVVPALLRPWLTANERLGLAALVAVSPLLIHFSRFVRPYAMVVLLGFAAMILLWQWWHHGGRARAAGFFACAVLAAWLHPLTTIYTGTALTWFAVAGIVRWRNGEGARPLWSVVVLGGLTTAACCALILPPLLADTASIAVKTGKHSIELETLMRSWEMLFGVGHFLLASVLAVPVCVGARALWRRDRAFLAFWIAATSIAVVVVQLLGPEWIRNALVLVRYTVVSMPVVLALLVVGMLKIIEAGLVRLAASRSLAPTVFLALVAALYLAGPLPETYRGVNQFTNAARYQIDYNFERSVFHPIMSPIETPDFYDEIAEEPGRWQLVEAAWHFESNSTPISQFQRDHGLKMHIGMISGLCTDWTPGEIMPDDDLDIELNRFIFLREILEGPNEVNRFVVFPLDHPFDYELRELPDLAPCIEAFRERFGEPWYRSDDYVVFRLPASGRGGDA